MVAVGMSGFPVAVKLPATGTAGAPAAGSWATGQLAQDSGGNVWVCTAGGTPGTWLELSTAVISSTAPTNGLAVAAAAGVGASAAAFDHSHPLVSSGRTIHAFAITNAGQQLSATRDVMVSSSIKNTSAAGTVSTIINISPDNVTYTGVFQVQLPSTTVGTFELPFSLWLPAGWFIKSGNLTNAADGGHGAWW